MHTKPVVLLYCFPYAGASAAVYLKWRRKLPAWIEVVPVDPPGHGRRLAEPLRATMEGMVEGVRAAVRPAPGQPYALFGHSLGAVVAFELAHALRREGASDPLLVFASGTCAPTLRDARAERPAHTDKELLEELGALRGTPPAVLADPELMALTLPILRADFAASASYRCPPGRRIGCALQALGGLDDATTLTQLRGWQQHTEGDFMLNMFPSGHFFLHEHESAVLGLIENRLGAALAARRTASLGEPARGRRERGGVDAPAMLAEE